MCFFFLYSLLFAFNQRRDMMENGYNLKRLIRTSFYTIYKMYLPLNISVFILFLNGDCEMSARLFENYCVDIVKNLGWITVSTLFYYLQQIMSKIIWQS